MAATRGTSGAGPEAASRTTGVLVPAAIGGTIVTAGYLADLSATAYGLLIIAVAISVGIAVAAITRGPRTSTTMAALLALIGIVTTGAVSLFFTALIGAFAA